jgi:hypothetical protein
MHYWPTFWKPSESGELVRVNMDKLVNVDPIGSECDVQDRLLSIPKTYKFPNLMEGYKSVFWDVGSGVEVGFRSEPEFGEDEVFSLILHRRSVKPKDFFRFYLQLFEMFGAVMLADGRFVTVTEFKKEKL